MSVQHRDSEGSGPQRAVVIGASGFVGGAIAKGLAERGVETVALGSRDVDLLDPGNAEALRERVNPGDAVVIAAARAPCKDYRMLLDNIAMQTTILDAIVPAGPSHVLYVSSDAVYSDSDDPLNESSVTAPEALHGVMHVARETMIRAALPDTPVACLRPTLVYGAADPHNGYGPNRFRRLAQAGEPIVLFGAGEERRDHVAVEDVAELAVRMVMFRSEGVLNAATGHVISFMETAQLMASQAESPVEVVTTERQGEMPHRGYRPFDPAGVAEAFPDFAFELPEAGFRRLYEQTKAG